MADFCKNKNCGKPLTHYPKKKKKECCNSYCRLAYFNQVKARPTVMCIPIAEWDDLQIELAMLRQFQQQGVYKPIYSTEPVSSPVYGNPADFIINGKPPRLNDETGIDYKIRMALLEEKNIKK